MRLCPFCKYLHFGICREEFEAVDRFFTPPSAMVTPPPAEEVTPPPAEEVTP